SPVAPRPPRCLRLEAEPKTAAHHVCAKNPIGPATELAFGGAGVIDTDGPFLEDHPGEDFRIVRSGRMSRGEGSPGRRARAPARSLPLALAPRVLVPAPAIVGAAAPRDLQRPGGLGERI